MSGARKVLFLSPLKNCEPGHLFFRCRGRNTCFHADRPEVNFGAGELLCGGERLLGRRSISVPACTRRNAPPRDIVICVGETPRLLRESATHLNRSHAAML
jgi:hypothetical protein